jgi:hypothetical protein
MYVSIVCPYILYAVAYRHPGWFLRIMSPSHFETLALAFKVVSNCLQAYVCLRCGFNLTGSAIGLPLIALGQYLNYLVYRRLGKVRVYYGYEFGVVKGDILGGFPFSVYHAQYKGCIMSVVGLMLACNECRELTIATMLWIVSYLGITWVESGPSGPIPKDPD